MIKRKCNSIEVDEGSGSKDRVLPCCYCIGRREREREVRGKAKRE